ncbi:hypothetical protein ACFCWY_04235 [Streptomyces sp. NPDC056362]|uniref:hypothetical protein n=1 Tax=unclassified Streptomyces TaxID=2593676 RepID=UPI0035DD0ABD
MVSTEEHVDGVLGVPDVHPGDVHVVMGKPMQRLNEELQLLVRQPLVVHRTHPRQQIPGPRHSGGFWGVRRYRTGMGSGRRSWRDRLGTPKTFVLYRTPEVWRIAVYFSGAIVDGHLHQPSADSEPAEAQTAAHAKAEELAGRPLTITWEASDKPGWWTGAITPEPPEPMAADSTGHPRSL